MKTTITYEFDSEDTYQDNEIRRITNHTCTYLALFDISNHLRSLSKQEHSDELDQCIDKIRVRFFEILEDNHISLDDLE